MSHDVEWGSSSSSSSLEDEEEVSLSVVDLVSSSSEEEDEETPDAQTPTLESASSATMAAFQERKRVRAARAAELRAAREKLQRKRQKRVDSKCETLLFSLFSLTALNKQASHASSLIRAELPAKLVDALSGRTKPGLTLWLSWVRANFRVEQPDTSSARLIKFGRLTSLLTTKVGTEEEICQLLVAGARACGVPSRLVAPLTEVYENLEQIPSTKETPKPQQIWCEFFLRKDGEAAGEGAWYAALGSVQAVSAFHTKHARSFLKFPGLERTSPRGWTETYVVGVGDLGQVTDLTPKYAKSWPTAEKARHASVQSWMERTILNPDRPIDAQAPCCDAFLEVFRNEARVARAAASEASAGGAIREEMPSSLDGFRKSSSFAHPKTLGKHERLRPGAAPVGTFKGEFVYARDAVEKQLTRHAWQRLGRVLMKPETAREDLLLEDEDEAPTAGAAAKKLYPEHETVPVDPGHVRSGSEPIPKNDYGNIEIWCDAFVPRGCVHVREPEASEAAAAVLPVHAFACAVVGFDWRNAAATGPPGGKGKSAAIFDGVVVHEENAPLVWGEIERVRAQREAAKRERLEREAVSQFHLWLNAALTISLLKNRRSWTQTLNEGSARSLGGGAGEEPEETEL